MREMTPLRGNAVESLEVIQSFVIPEARRLLLKTDIDKAPNPTDWFWELIHPRVASLSRPRFEAGFFGDAVEASYKEVNDVAKRIVKDVDGRELDGATLMTTAFSPKRPLIRLTSLETETGPKHPAGLPADHGGGNDRNPQSRRPRQSQSGRQPGSTSHMSGKPSHAQD